MAIVIILILASIPSVAALIYCIYIFTKPLGKINLKGFIAKIKTTEYRELKKNDLKYLVSTAIFAAFFLFLLGLVISLYEDYSTTFIAVGYLLLPKLWTLVKNGVIGFVVYIIAKATFYSLVEAISDRVVYKMQQHKITSFEDEL